MKKKLVYLALLSIIAVVFFVNQSSCKKGSLSQGLFGNVAQSPLRAENETTKAFEIQDTFRKIYDLYSDSVVFISTEQLVRIKPNPFFDDPFVRGFFHQRQRVEKRRGLGTGFVLSEDGYICTNNHVINGVDKIKVRIAGDSYTAKLIGADSRTDIALLKITPKKKLHPVYLGNSEKVHVGDWAIAIGNPFGLDRTFTVGVVSAIGRHDLDLMGGSHIQTDASINPGNSGGPLINIYGEVIGINRMIYSKSGGSMGIGFAIPVNVARSVLVQLKKYRMVKRGYLGVSVVPLNSWNRKQFGVKSNDGVLVGEVLGGSPAYIGGIKVGDVILKVNSKKIHTYKDLVRIINNTQLGKTLRVVVWRKRNKRVLSIVITERPGI